MYFPKVDVGTTLYFCWRGCPLCCCWHGSCPLYCCLTWTILFILLFVGTHILKHHSRGTAATFFSPYILDASSAPFQPHVLPPSLTFPKWCPRVTKLGYRVGCGRLLAPVAVGTTRTTLRAPDLTTRSRGTLPGRRILTVALLQLRPSMYPEARIHQRPNWTEARRRGRKRSCPPLAQRQARINPCHVQQNASSWPPHARQ